MFYLIILFFLIASFQLFPEEQVKNSIEQDVPQDYTIDKYALGSGSSFFTLKNRPHVTEESTESYALTKLIDRAVVGIPVLNPVIPRKAKVNNEKNVDNPLWESNITYLKTIKSMPFIVTKEHPDVLYYIERPLLSDFVVHHTDPIKDAEGGSARIIEMTNGAIVTPEERYDYFFTLVAPQDKPFGSLGSGIAVIRRDFNEVRVSNGYRSENQNRYYFKNLDVIEGREGNRAFPLDKYTPELSINNGLEEISKDVAFHWDKSVGRLYIGLNVTTKNDAREDQGAQALLIGRIFDDCVELGLVSLTQINPFFSAVGPGRQACVHHIKTLQTTTGISYLVVVGGKGSYEQTKKKVYALPLVHRSGDKSINSYFDMYSDSVQGTFASQYAQPVVHFFKSGRRTRFNSRILSEPIAEQSQFYDENDPKIIVGNDEILPGPVDSVNVVGDAIFASVGQDDNGNRGGLFVSRPLFDAEGKIAGWTDWSRIGGFQHGALNAKINAKNGTLMVVNTKKNLECLEESTWRGYTQLERAISLSEVITERFEPVGGLQGFFAFNEKNNDGNKEVQTSLLLATANEKVALIQTGAQDALGLFTAFPNDFSHNYQGFKNGSLNGFNPSVFADDMPTVLDISGGILKDLGGISTAVLVSDDEQSWLVVGGYKGIAVLSDKNGHGWSKEKGLMAKFKGLSSEFSFKKLDAFSGVKKLMSVENQLYILSNKRLERVEISPEIVKAGKCSVCKVVESKNRMGAFHDAIVSGPCALLATTKGLFVNDCSSDVSLQGDRDISWRLIALSNTDELLPVYKLSLVTKTGREADFAYGAQLFALATTWRGDSTSVYRLYVDNIFEKGFDEDSIKVISDFESNKSDPFFVFNDFRNLFLTDGAFYFSSYPGRSGNKPFVHMINPNVIGKTFVNNQLCYKLPLKIKKGKTINAIVQDPATGNWLIAGDFGLRMSCPLK